jgi:hypothetical protein
MADLLDEIMHTPTSAQPSRQHPNTAHHPEMDAQVGIRGWGGDFSNSHTSKATPDADQALRSPQLSPNPHPWTIAPIPNKIPVIPQQDDDAMDWSPTQSRHRAFSSFRTSPGFSQAPTQEKKGTFWYHVPPAPTSIAQQQIPNPMNRPRLVSKTPNTGPEISFRGAGERTQSEAAPAEKPSQVLFADPHFFPPAQDDPRDPLTDMFAESFTLSQHEEESQKEEESRKNEERSWVGRMMGRKKDH